MILNSKTPAAAAASILRVILGPIFMYAAWIKLREPWALFAISIDSYQVLPLWAVEFIARTLPWLELLLGALLIAGIWRGVAAAAATLLLGVFFGLMIRAMAKGMQIDCAVSDLGSACRGSRCYATGRCWQVPCLLPAWLSGARQRH